MDDAQLRALATSLCDQVRELDIVAHVTEAAEQVAVLTRR